ncbi:MAG: VgrG-related protein [Chloroflexi bacterium]|nr:VgrG-related protein [Chloroflexota bacterium]
MPPPTQLAPRIYLKFNGTDASEQVTDAIVSVEVDDSLTLPDMFAIHLRDPNLQWIDADTFSIGTPVEVSSRNGNAEVTLLKGEITAIEPRMNSTLGPTVLVRGYDKAHRLNRDRKTQSFLQMTDSDIASRVAQGASLQAQTDSTQQVHDHVIQDNQTDWEFLASRAGRVGFRVYVVDSTLHFKQLPSSGSQATLEWAADLMEFNARLTSAHQVTEVAVQGWDPANQQQIVGRATQPNDTPQIGQNQQGPAVAQQAFGQAKEIVVNRPVVTQAEADAMAQAICDELGQGFVEADCVSLGNPAVKAGVLVRLNGLGNRFSGTYRVMHSLHRYDESGYKTEFTIGSPHTATISELLSDMTHTTPATWGPMLGVITNNSDPDDLGRVKVKLPCLKSDIESNWARLVAPGAGTTRGMQFIPEVNDEVMVAFEHGDINRPLVIGGLWSQNIALPKANSQCISGGNVNERIIQSRSGHVIILGDEQGSEKITIRDKTGKNEVVIDSAQNTMTVKCEQDITVEAKGKINVKSTTGDMAFEGNNMEIKARQNFKVQATGSCEIKSTSSCTVEGTAGLTLKNAAAQIALSGPTVNVNNGALEVM